MITDYLTAEGKRALEIAGMPKCGCLHNHGVDGLLVHETHYGWLLQYHGVLPDIGALALLRDHLRQYPAKVGFGYEESLASGGYSLQIFDGTDWRVIDGQPDWDIDQYWIAAILKIHATIAAEKKGEEA